MYPGIDMVTCRSVRSIAISIIPQIFVAFPVNFDGIQLSKGRDEVRGALFILPNDGEVIDHQGEPDAAVMFAEKGRRVGKLSIPMFLQMPKKSFLRESARLR
jgi:hypothetical protein